MKIKIYRNLLALALFSSLLFGGAGIAAENRLTTAKEVNHKTFSIAVPKRDDMRVVEKNAYGALYVEIKRGAITGAYLKPTNGRIQELALATSGSGANGRKCKVTLKAPGKPAKTFIVPCAWITVKPVPE